MVLPPTYPQQPPPCADEPVLVSPYASSLHLQNPGVFQRDALRPPAAPAPAPAHGTHATHATQPIQRPNTEDKQAYRQPVYIVRCAHCNTFFTDRGMRALLLLKPNVSLFSTDAIPTNCSAVYAPEAVLEQEVDPESPKQRTCTCLTQTLGCNGCGSVVGYHVVSPCHRCSTNVARHTRSSNGHRIVFHCTEISTHERRYVPGDRGVKAMQVPIRLEELLQDQRTLSSYLQSLNQSGQVPTALVLKDFATKDVSEVARFVQAKLWRITQQIRMVYASLVKQYNAGARIILRGETVYWSDLHLEGGDRTRPFDPDEVLDPLSVLGR